MKFCKMNGIGNDYIFVYLPEERVEDPARAARLLSNRYTGIGGDGLVLIGESAKADFSMRIYNADGSEAMMCGNAVRCVGKYVYERGFTQKTTLQIDTLSGVRTLELHNAGHRVHSVTVDMGEPALLPFCGESKVHCPFPVSHGVLTATFVSVGNPHAVVFVNEFQKNTLQTAEEISLSSAFPGGINAEIARVLDRNTLEAVVWERGAGPTQACGTGASAVMYAAYMRGLVGDSVTVRLPGGALEITYSGGRIHMQGTAHYNYTGYTNLLEGDTALLWSN